jgi:hypothetical protein
MFRPGKILLILLTIISSFGFLCAEKKSGYTIITERELDKGLVYKNILFGNGRNKHSVHILEADLMNPALSIEVMKSGDNVHHLGRLHDIINFADSINGEKEILGAVNANFWRAYSNRPMGPTIINGEPAEIIRYKLWSSIFFDEMSLPVIDSFEVKGFLTIEDKEFEIGYVNRRHDSSGIVLYNRFAGDTIPFIMNRTIEKEFKQMQKNSAENDSTEKELSFDDFRYQIEEDKRQSSLEYETTKLILSYIGKPRINKSLKCKVIGIESGKIAMPEDGCIVSLGYDYIGPIPKAGDEISIRFETNVHKDIVFLNAVSGTPRLVRDGTAKHEAYKEGSKGSRFIRRGLARTAIGVDEHNQKIFIVTVEHTQSSKRKCGATLANMATIMKGIGCYNAMNLDGGGSSVMVIDSVNVMRESKPDYSRKISVGIGIEKKKLNLQNIFKTD